MAANASGAAAADQPVNPMRIVRRAVRKSDVEIAILFRGVRHSNLHQVRSEWGGTL